MYDYEVHFGSGTLKGTLGKDTFYCAGLEV